MNTPTVAELLRLKDLAEAYLDAMHLDNVIEASEGAKGIETASNTNISRAAHRVAKAAAEIFTPQIFGVAAERILSGAKGSK
mgnify:FL=1